jgi:hypothetical protein
LIGLTVIAIVSLVLGYKEIVYLAVGAIIGYMIKWNVEYKKREED